MNNTNRQKADRLLEIAYGDNPLAGVHEFADILGGINGKYYRHTLFSLDIKGYNTLFGSPEVFVAEDGKKTVIFLASSRGDNSSCDITENATIASEAMKNIAGEIDARLKLEDASKQEYKKVIENARAIEEAHKRNNDKQGNNGI